MIAIYLSNYEIILLVHLLICNLIDSLNLIDKSVCKRDGLLSYASIIAIFVSVQLDYMFTYLSSLFPNSFSSIIPLGTLEEGHHSLAFYPCSFRVPWDHLLWPP